MGKVLSNLTYQFTLKEQIIMEEIYHKIHRLHLQMQIHKNLNYTYSLRLKEYQKKFKI
jgi:hypothetical protein